MLRILIVLFVLYPTILLAGWTATGTNIESLLNFGYTIIQVISNKCEGHYCHEEFYLRKGIRLYRCSIIMTKGTKKYDEVCYLYKKDIGEN